MKNVTELSRELGAAIQADERYIAAMAAKEANDKDETLQADIGAFNLARMNLNVEMSKGEDEKDQAMIESLNKQIRELYQKVMTNPGMLAFSQAKPGLDALINEINTIIDASLNGEDPYEVDLEAKAASCGGNCASCGGCH